MKVKGPESGYKLDHDPSLKFLILSNLSLFHSSFLTLRSTHGLFSHLQRLLRSRVTDSSTFFFRLCPLCEQPKPLPSLLHASSLPHTQQHISWEPSEDHPMVCLPACCSCCVVIVDRRHLFVFRHIACSTSLRVPFHVESSRHHFFIFYVELVYREHSTDDVYFVCLP